MRSHVSGCFSPKLICFTNEIHVYHVAVPGLACECRCRSVLKMVPDIDKMFLFLRFFFFFLSETGCTNEAGPTGKYI